jgi:Na+/melibiose symporter-like transporter
MQGHPRPVFTRVRSFHGTDFLKINILFFALAALSQGMHSIILPVRVLDFVSDAQKNTFLGLMTFIGLAIAMFYQPLAGTISDRARTRWGRRRPFITFGVIGLIVCLIGVGVAESYASLFIAYCLMQFAGNTAQGPYQALLPECAPANKRGQASGIKNLMEVTGGAVMVGLSSILIGKYQDTRSFLWLWLALASIAVVLIIALILTLAWIKESGTGNGTPPAPLRTALVRTFHINLRCDRTFAFFLLSRALVFMALTTIQQFALYFFRDVIKVPNPAAATFTFLGIAVFIMVVGAYPAGRLGDRYPRHKVSAIAAWTGAAAVLLIIALPREYNLLLFPAAVLGAALVAFATSNWALAADLVVPGEEARYLGLANMATAGGGAVARLIGPVIDYFNQRSANMGYEVMLGACVLYFIMGGLILLRLQPPKRLIIPQPNTAA